MKTARWFFFLNFAKNVFLACFDLQVFDFLWPNLLRYRSEIWSTYGVPLCILWQKYTITSDTHKQRHKIFPNFLPSRISTRALTLEFLIFHGQTCWDIEVKIFIRIRLLSVYLKKKLIIPSDTWKQRNDFFSECCKIWRVFWFPRF